MNPNWSAVGYISGAKNLTFMYEWFKQPMVLPVVNFLNVWGQIALGASLITGVGLKLSTKLGALLMLLYYLALPFPKQNPNSYVVDEHIVYALGLLLVGVMGKERGWKKWFGKK